VSDGGNSAGALDGFRILDASDGIAGQFAGRILADLGADVRLAERPGGSRVRALPPLSPAGDSALFWHLNAGKAAVLVPSGPAGAAQIGRLAAGCDAVILDGSADAGLTRALGTDPGLVVCQVTDFARHGPYASWQGSEMIHQALSGLMFLTGRGSRAPRYGNGQRAYYSAGAAAAAATLAALLERRRSGLGQQVSLSVHEVAAAMAQNLVTRYSYNGSYPTRHRYAGACDIFACRDGWAVVFCPPGRWPALCQALGSVDAGTAAEGPPRRRRRGHGAAGQGDVRPGHDHGRHPGLRAPRRPGLLAQHRPARPAAGAARPAVPDERHPAGQPAASAGPLSRGRRPRPGLPPAPARRTRG